MIYSNAHYEACRILGIAYQADRDTWKSAYREICRKYHPDVLTEEYVKKCGYTDEQLQQVEDYFKQATRAYEFLEKEAAAGSVLQANVPSGNYTANAQPRPTKVMGGQAASHVSHASYQKKQEEFRRKKIKEQKEKQEELQKAAAEIQRKEQEEKILDQIRWIRVSEIIRNVMLRDKLEKEIEKKQKDQ